METGYDVFLSVRGELRDSFALHLYKALESVGLKPFMKKEDVIPSDELTPTIFGAIENSKSAIVIFSPNYASSKRRLNELLPIIQRREESKTFFIMPILYFVDMNDIKRRFPAEVEGHKSTTVDDQKIKSWKNAFAQIEDTYAQHFTDREYVKDFAQKIATVFTEKFSAMQGKPAPKVILSKMETGYDVFLSFRGELRDSFALPLYKALESVGLKPFIDKEDVIPSDELTPKIFGAIENSKSAIVIFSPNYASSTFCLDELLPILQRREESKTFFIMPILYFVNMNDVKRRFPAEVEGHKSTTVDDQKIKSWKNAFAQIEDTYAKHFSDREYVKDFAPKIAALITERFSAMQG